MSLSYEKLNLASCYDPLVGGIDDKKLYVVVKGQSDVTYYQSTAQSNTTGSIQFSLAIPSPQTIIDRKMYLTYYVDFVFDGDLDLAVKDSLRQFPISTCMTQLSATINSQTVSIDMSDVIQPLMRYKANNELLARDYTLAPCARDVYNSYADAVTYGTARSPLSNFGSSGPMGENRGGFELNVLSARNVRAVVTEPLFLDPFVSASDDEAGLVGITSMTLNITNSNGLSRMWSSYNNAITTATVTFYANPVVTYKTVQPLATQHIPKSVNYRYNQIDRYSTAGGALAAGSSTTITTANVQLQTMPHSIYVFARQRNADQTFKSSDSYASITAVNVLFAGKSGLLASCPQANLYQISKKNGYIGGFQEWSLYNGSVLRLKPSWDLALNETLAPGCQGTFNLQLQVTYKNINSASINYDVFVIVEQEGVFSIINGVANKVVGPLSPSDVLNSHPVMKRQHVEAMGGSFFSDVWSGIKSVASNPVVRGLVSNVGVPLLKKAVGLGALKKKAKKRGGAAISSSELQNRLNGFDPKQQESDEEDDE